MTNLSIEKLTEGAETLRKCANILDECKAIILNQEVDEKEKEELMEMAMARLVVCAMKAQSIFEQVEYAEAYSKCWGDVQW